MAFVKVHTDILSDPKLMRAARKGAKHLKILPWIVVFAKECEDYGRLSIGSEMAEPEDIAQHIPDCSVEEVAGCLASLRAIGILQADADGVLRFVNWSTRNDPPSSAPSAVRERVKRFREKKQKERNKAGNDPVTSTGNDLGNDPCNDPVTPPCNETEKEKEEELEKELEGEVGAAARTKPDDNNDGERSISAWPEVKKLFPDVTHQAGVMALLGRLPRDAADRLAAVIPMWFAGGRGNFVPTALEVATGFAEYTGAGDPRHVWAFVSDVHHGRVPTRVGASALSTLERIQQHQRQVSRP